MGIRRGIVYKFRKSLRKRGVAGTVKECFRVAPLLFMKMTPSWRRHKAEQRKFDSERGLVTESLIFLDDMEIPGPNAALGSAYQATAVGDLEAVLDELALDYSGYTFIDIGCGLGRPLFAAAEYPFRRIVGVEFAPDLHALASRNLASYRSGRQRCRQIEVLCMDGADYIFPAEKTVLFLFNPFKQPVMEIVLANLERSLAESPRHVVILYRWPYLKDLFDRAPYLRLVKTKPHWAIYETSV